MPPIPPLFILPIEPNGKLTWYVLPPPFPSFTVISPQVVGPREESTLPPCPHPNKALLTSIPRLVRSMLTFYSQSKHSTFSPRLSSHLRNAPGQPPHSLLLQCALARARHTRPPLSQRRRGHDVGHTQILQQWVGLRECGEGRAEIFQWKLVSSLEAAIDVRTNDLHPESMKAFTEMRVWT